MKLISWLRTRTTSTRLPGPAERTTPIPSCPPGQNTIYGTDGNDVRTGTPVNDVMFAGEGDDVFEGEAGGTSWNHGKRVRRTDQPEGIKHRWRRTFHAT